MLNGNGARKGEEGGVKPGGVVRRGKKCWSRDARCNGAGHTAQVVGAQMEEWAGFRERRDIDENGHWSTEKLCSAVDEALGRTEFGEEGA